MKQRCECPTHKSFANYGGRGIKVCDRWQDFSKFYADMGDIPPNCSLNRINNDGDYEPSNCEWATHAAQCRNTRVNHYITHNGETLTITDWGVRIGGTASAVRCRLRDGWPVDRAVTTPVAERYR